MDNHYHLDHILLMHQITSYLHQQHIQDQHLIQQHQHRHQDHGVNRQGRLERERPNGDVDLQLFSDCAGAAVLSRTADTNNEVFTYLNNTTSNTIYMRVYLGADTRNNYNFTFTITTPAPDNDECAFATAVVAGTYPFNTTGATNSALAIAASCTDGAGATASKSVQVTYQTAPTGGKTTPTVTIVSPNTTFLMTPTYSVALRGTAKDSAGVTEVRWECTCGTSGAAQGTSNWTVPNVSLALGSQKIKITARNASGGEGTATITVFRYEN